MAQIINASRKTYESIRRNYNLAKQQGRSGFSVWGNYMRLAKAEMIMNMIELSLDLPIGYVKATEYDVKGFRKNRNSIKEIPPEKLIPFDYEKDNTYCFVKGDEAIEGRRLIKLLLCKQS